MATPYRAIPNTNLEQQSFNHFGHFLFTNLILGKVLAASTPAFPSRVINVSSIGHQRSTVRFDDLGFEGGKTYDPWVGYGQAKVCLCVG